eukprot:SM000013S26462  [mRNA]  locus=s13:541243:542774:+ [translate_table: standard]
MAATAAAATAVAAAAPRSSRCLEEASVPTVGGHWGAEAAATAAMPLLAGRGAAAPAVAARLQRRRRSLRRPSSAALLLPRRCPTAFFMASATKQPEEEETRAQPDQGGNIQLARLVADPVECSTPTPKPWATSSAAAVALSALALLPSSAALASEASRPLTEGLWLSTAAATGSLFLLGDLDPGSAKVISSLLGPIIAGLNFLFIVRIVMSWYPSLPVNKLPYSVAYVPTEPVLGPTRRLIPPVGGVDVSPVIWVALMSFVNEVLLGPQGLLVLLSQQQR